MVFNPKELFKGHQEAHKYSDIDGDATSQHHTLGKGAYQAAPGNHKHPDLSPITHNHDGAYSLDTHNHDSNYVPIADNGWTAWTPGLTNITLGDGTIRGSYKKIGSVVHYRITLYWGSTTSYTSLPMFQLPLTPADGYNYGDPMGYGFMLDYSVGSSSRTACTPIKEATGADLEVFIIIDRLSTNATMTATVPWTWATSDLVKIAGTYETSV